VTGRQIVALGGLTPLPGDRHPMIEFLLSLAGSARPRIAYLPTATGDSAESIVTFHRRFPADRCEPVTLTLFNRRVEDLRAFLLSRDLIFVGGGNTANMLAVWRVHGVDEILREAWERGIVLCGGSAGSLCWFECGTTDSFNLDKLAPLHDGLGFLPGSHCPHYRMEPGRRPLYQQLVADGFPGGIAIDDDAAAHYSGTDLTEVVTVAEGATAYLVERVDGRAVETPLAARLLTGGST
jgi:peptidase E